MPRVPPFSQTHTFSVRCTRPLDLCRDLHAALRTATLRADEPGQAVLMNALLRNYLEDNLVDQAQRLVSKTVWPESSSNSEAARFLYYLGRIKAIQLDYSEANTNLELVC